MGLRLLFALLSVSLAVSVFGKPVAEVFDEQVYSAVTKIFPLKFQSFPLKVADDKPGLQGSSLFESSLNVFVES